ncbi:23251_t:CDS:2 [Gigaspora margarita]|uniref:23251_t:CDS:1 n=1 Tax=Gigaspora margarita TaxID=4874 RepID=A0ABN7VGR9_GIGMA|nr:23251_t:CDS:2 [Gigaspora margarita]
MYKLYHICDKLTRANNNNILQEVLNNNTDKNAASKRKSLILTETIIQNSKHFKEDSTVSAQQRTKSTILSLKNEKSISKTKNEDIYSSQWAVTRNEAEASQKPILSPKNKNIGARKNLLRGSLLDKTNASSSTQRITEVRKQIYSSFSSKKRPWSDSRSSSKEHSRPNKLVNLDSKAKYTGKENIS